MSESTTQSVNIFVIYAREDADALAEFQKSLKPLISRGEINLWSDGEIIAGQEWEKAIEHNLRVADIIVLFLSNNFFSSHYIEKKELVKALERHEKEEVAIVPIVVRHCLWQEHPQIERLQVLPDNAYPVFSKKHWDGPDEAFTNVAAGIARSAREISKKRKEISAALEKAAEELEKAVEARDQENFEAAFLIFEQYKDSPLFEGKYQCQLGYMHEDLADDYQEAKIWYEKAIKNGNAEAMKNLGRLYSKGYGVIQDYQQAKIWYEKAAEKGNKGAMNNLGWLYQNGEGVTQDYQQAKIWYEKAAEKGELAAIINLGNLYNFGWGVPKDVQKAEEWYKKADQHRHEYKKTWL